ncbi:putative GTP-binding protein 4 [Blattamonas nauphoetae]|uniref:GTP-binding protein 4 n=1 Tax=Blattamonas nauphoetae TaxID=2049346 RepID=A0ABQ9YKW6_9EUKA|nr:putative GTP-binding protein 4 [Blattamonas nauphoetae]
MSYNFTRIPPVPSAEELVNIALSYTQRKTPTEIHTSFKISRIRSFYMRKVKTTQQVLHKKLTEILERFPRLDDIHPFFADLMNVLYDKDHYKLALGQLNMARSLIGNLARDYTKMLKYGDSLYRCKQLKRAALGRMCTVIKKIKHSFDYLENVRQHLSRIPSINPTTRTLIICGYPNAGKSSFVNKITRANVEVEPYAFTTKSLLIGHTDYKYVPWQVMDTPGILDHPLEERNTIEMQSITALAHLSASILYFIDLSMHSGFTLEEQALLFKHIKPLFGGKPLIIVFSKSDICRFSDLDHDAQVTVSSMIGVSPADILSGGNRHFWAQQENASEINETLLWSSGPSINGSSVDIVELSTLTENGINICKQISCERLLALRETLKSITRAEDDLTSRARIATPSTKTTDRAPIIPQSVLDARERKASGMDVDVPTRELERDLALRLQGDYRPTIREHYIVENEDQRWDIIPEFLDGKNIADFVDPDIDAKLAALEEEEAILVEEENRMRENGELDDFDIPHDHHIQRPQSEISTKGERLKLRANMVKEKAKAREQKWEERKKERYGDQQEGDEAMQRGRSRTRDIDSDDDSSSDGEIRKKKHKVRQGSVARSFSATRPIPQRSQSKNRAAPRDAWSLKLVNDAVETDKGRREEGFKSSEDKKRARKMMKKVQKEHFRGGKMGEGDTHVDNRRPKHLFTGKMSLGTRDRR